ncbi:hemolysin family protein [Leptolyngbya sp. AN03gr2]|uniref:hemolysin family protein n=1 Tax=unclassified Leptolyngbya TaxID=2650499 RepID=UPI003D321E52
MLQLFFAILIVLSGSALCSSVEIAILSVSILKVKQLDQSRPAVAALLTIRKRINRPITALVILNNLFNIVGSIAIAEIANRVLGDALLGIFSGVLTFLIIIFGEIIPKTLGEQYSLQLALLAAIPLKFFAIVMTPIIWLMEKVTAPITKNAASSRISRSEIELMATMGHEEGVIDDQEADLIRRLFRFSDAIAADLMTPRLALTYLYQDSTLKQVQTQIIESQHSRIVVADESIDQAVGVVLKAQLLSALVNGEGERTIASLTRTVQFVPETMRADSLLTLFQKSHEHLAIVVNEYGVTAGVITLEDVLELLTGEIVDETDKTADLRATARKIARKLFDLSSS